MQGIFKCELCDRKYGWKPELAGKRVKCKCGQVIRVPVSDEAPNVVQITPPAIPCLSQAVARDVAIMSAPMAAVSIEQEGFAHPTLDYNTPTRKTPAIPGIVISIGVMSILVAIASFICSGISAVLWWIWYDGSAHPTYLPLMPGNPAAMQMLSFYCVASAGLAIYLLVAGILALVRPHTVVKTHRLYALLKYACMATGLVLSLFYFSGVESMHTNATNSFNFDMGMRGLVMTLLVQAIYPSALLIVFGSHSEFKNEAAEH